MMYYLTPTSEEVFSRFSPELQQHNLENRERRQIEYEDFVGKLKEYSKSDKPIWEAAKIAQEEARRKMAEQQKLEVEEQRGVKEASRREIEGGR
jgi:hypothetical protein